MNWAPGLLVEQVEAYYTVRVDMGVYWYLVFGVLDEDNFWGLNRIAWAKLEHQPVCLVLVQRVVVQDFDVHDPFLEVVCRYEGDTRGNMLVKLDELLLQSL